MRPLVRRVCPSSGWASPRRTTGRPRSRRSKPAAGIVPPERTHAGSVPKPRRQAADTASMTRCGRSSTAGGTWLPARTRVWTVGGAAPQGAVVAAAPPRPGPGRARAGPRAWQRRGAGSRSCFPRPGSQRSVRSPSPPGAGSSAPTHSTRARPTQPVRPPRAATPARTVPRPPLAYDHLAQCLQSLERFACDEIVVVDHHTQPQSLEPLATRFPRVRFIPLAGNPGFAAGVNPWCEGNDPRLRPAAESGRIVTSDVHPLAAWLDAHPGAAVCGGVVHEAHGTIQARRAGLLASRPALPAAPVGSRACGRATRSPRGPW